MHTKLIPSSPNNIRRTVHITKLPLFCHGLRLWVWGCL